MRLIAVSHDHCARQKGGAMCGKTIVSDTNSHGGARRLMLSVELRLSWLLCLLVCMCIPGHEGKALMNQTRAPAKLTAGQAEQDLHGGPELSSCEVGVLTRLGWEQAYNPAGYSVQAELPSNCSLGTWRSLGCLASLTSLTLYGSLPDWPDSWAATGSFPALRALYLVDAELAGSLPDSWAEPSGFPVLQVLNLTGTQLAGCLPASWGRPGAFGKLTELYVQDAPITGEQCAACWPRFQQESVNFKHSGHWCHQFQKHAQTWQRWK